MSKEEILEKHYTPGMNWESVRDGVLAAMDEYCALKDKEIERLKGLIEKAYKAGHVAGKQKLNFEWTIEAFKNANNL